MRPDRIVMAPPAFDDDLSFLEGVEDLAIEQLITQASVEALDVAVLPRTAPLDIGNLGADSGDPSLDSLGDELRSVVGPDVTGNAAQDEQIGENVDDIDCFELAGDTDRQAFVGKLVNDIEHPISASIVMPDLDGWSVLAALRQDSELSEIPVIMVTILDQQRRGVALGAAGYLTKPIDREQLHRLVERVRAQAQPTRVLLVEDDSFQRERMHAWLESQRWVVQEAANGREALDRLQQSKPDLILLDLMMPEMDGFQVVATLQKEAGWRDIPVIVITALDLDAKDRDRLNSGVQSVLVKETFQPADLVERIRRLAQTRTAVNSGAEPAS